MNTLTHWLMTWALGKKLGMKKYLKYFAWGSVAPDILLYILTFVGLAYYGAQGWTMSESFKFMFDNLYFNDPFWIFFHNVLHAPIILFGGLALCLLYRNRFRIAKGLTWFFGGACLHTLIDIVTHVNDGPLILFPFNWTYRFNGPVSYWDTMYYGHEFFIFELSLVIVLVGYLVYTSAWFRRWATSN